MTVEKLLEGCEHDGSYIPVGEVKILMQKYAYFKCLEAIKNTRHRACDLCLEYNIETSIYDELQRDIQNIYNQDVMPEI